MLTKTPPEQLGDQSGTSGSLNDVEFLEQIADEVRDFVNEKFSQSGAQIKQQVQGLFADLANSQREDAILELAAALRASVTESALMRGQIRDMVQALAAPRTIITDANGKPIGVRNGPPTPDQLKGP